MAVVGPTPGQKAKRFALSWQFISWVLLSVGAYLVALTQDNIGDYWGPIVACVAAGVSALGSALAKEDSDVGDWWHSPGVILSVLGGAQALVAAANDTLGWQYGGIAMTTLVFLSMLARGREQNPAVASGLAPPSMVIPQGGTDADARLVGGTTART